MQGKSRFSILTSTPHTGTLEGVFRNCWSVSNSYLDVSNAHTHDGHFAVFERKKQSQCNLISHDVEIVPLKIRGDVVLKWHNYQRFLLGHSVVLEWPLNFLLWNAIGCLWLSCSWFRTLRYANIKATECKMNFLLKSGDFYTSVLVLTVFNVSNSTYCFSS